MKYYITLAAACVTLLLVSLIMRPSQYYRDGMYFYRISGDTPQLWTGTGWHDLNYPKTEKSASSSSARP